MKKFIFKSTDADLQKFDSILETIQKNVLYLTYRLDLVLKKVNTITVNENLQKQVDEYFEKDPFGSSFRTANKTADDDKDDELTAEQC